VAAADQVLSCDLGGEVAILHLKNGFFYGLNGAGTRIWDLLRTPKTLTEIRDASRDFGFAHLALQLDHTVFEESLRHAEPSNSWTMRMPLSGPGLLNLTGEFEDPDRAMVAAPFAHAMRRSLQSALLCLHSNDHP